MAGTIDAALLLAEAEIYVKETEKERDEVRSALVTLTKDHDEMGGAGVSLSREHDDARAALVRIKEERNTSRGLWKIVGG